MSYFTVYLETLLQFIVCTKAPLFYMSSSHSHKFLDEYHCVEEESIVYHEEEGTECNIEVSIVDQTSEDDHTTEQEDDQVSIVEEQWEDEVQRGEIKGSDQPPAPAFKQITKKTKKTTPKINRRRSSSSWSMVSAVQPSSTATSLKLAGLALTILPRINLWAKKLVTIINPPSIPSAKEELQRRRPQIDFNVSLNNDQIPEPAPFRKLIIKRQQQNELNVSFTEDLGSDPPSTKKPRPRDIRRIFERNFMLWEETAEGKDIKKRLLKEWVDVQEIRKSWTPFSNFMPWTMRRELEIVRTKVVRAKSFWTKMPQYNRPKK